LLQHGVAKNRPAVRGMIVDASSFKIAKLKFGRILWFESCSKRTGLDLDSGRNTRAHREGFRCKQSIGYSPIWLCWLMLLLGGVLFGEVQGFDRAVQVTRDDQ
jgi:hypothetical protein